MSEIRFADSAKVMARGQVTIPKDVREVLGVQPGNRVTFIVEGNTVRVVNSAVYGLELLADKLKGQAERVGLDSEDAILDLVNEVRQEIFDEQKKKGNGV